MSIVQIETLWREYLQVHAESRIRNELQTNWGDDPNIVQGRIQFAYPPTFQPGYIGKHFFESPSRILFIGYNPGEGRLQASQNEDRILSTQLAAFAEGQLSFDKLSDFLGAHIVKWPIYRDKGIFSETGDSRIALLPEGLRPSILSAALLNLFPFKTVSNKKPLAGHGGSSASLKTQMWECFVKPTIEALAPKFIVRYPDSDQYASGLENLKSQPRVVRVWHPSDYNLTAQREKLAKAWSSLAIEVSSIPQ